MRGHNISPGYPFLSGGLAVTKSGPISIYEESGKIWKCSIHLEDKHVLHLDHVCCILYMC